MIMKVNTGR